MLTEALTRNVYAGQDNQKAVELAHWVASARKLLNRQNEVEVSHGRVVFP
jgi:hypothetical protein